MAVLVLVLVLARYRALVRGVVPRPVVPATAGTPIGGSDPSGRRTVIT
ncbi:hypothetical protein FRAAL4865 [Frankia alni ACN14a]|uniref:Uncharacterized protein n=1 Tax=Frankia alni (strain DSM 45986 / CECT 9034 / ACN14a) TaxID=326424 RepID=Q0RG83_FRAAA|nr:hypothetical protein FRAAL4865 [Frankia alni ACN14a]